MVVTWSHWEATRVTLEADCQGPTFFCEEFLIVWPPLGAGCDLLVKIQVTGAWGFWEGLFLWGPNG